MIVIPLSRPDEAPLPPATRGGAASSSATPAAANGRPRRHRKQDVAASASADPSPRCTPSSSSTASSSRQPTPDTPAIPPSSTCSSAPHRDLARVWEAVSSSRRIVVVTGAGISVSAPANIPDFRSSTGLFKTLKEQHPNAGLSSGKDLFDARLFQSEANTALFYSMIAQLHDMTLAAQPTLFHHLIKRLDEQGRLQRVYTQNIDALEERAGLTFGLGNGARKTFQRTASLGKRKRLAAAAAAAATTDSSSDAPRPRWNKTQSAPVTPHLFGRDDSEPATAMFPRVIPLHGSLAHLVCTACDFRLSTLPTPTPQVQAALKELSSGETPSCPACSERDGVRIAAGLRSRGIGFLKPDVVLYNGDNKSGERVGECLERDVLGLRDRLDGQVPETYAEERARVRREDKAQATKMHVGAAEKHVDAAADAHAATSMSISDSKDSLAEDVLGQVFEDDEEEDKALVASELISTGISASPTAKLFEGVRAKRSLQRATTQPASAFAGPSASASTSKKTTSAAATKPLKPLPPDLLIVAGTSLKVPGTKRVVREFAKAARARDGIIPKGCASGSKASRENSKTPSSHSNSRSGSWESTAPSEAGSDDDDDNEDDEDELEDGTDPSRPIRTILLNYDFPVPSKEWEDIFDVWVQGDVQAAAGGLWGASSGYGSGNSIVNTSSAGGVGAGEEEDSISGVRSWDLALEELEETRNELKKAERAEKRARSQKEKEVEEGGGDESMSSVTTARKGGARRKSAVKKEGGEEDESDHSKPRLSPTVLIPKMSISEGGATMSKAKGRSAKNLAPSAKTNGGVDAMFPPAKRATGAAAGAKGAKPAAKPATMTARARKVSTGSAGRKASTAKAP
ncbi:DHS-like NAD/FAD-binding domain-containing protein [Jaminaea rosea]|uniref:DHS-like NAD/FAD-binding domain-containing protein n=1 Tax=Jaminaea rosea TaxID=1569628 RepID=A0A316UZG9_9BASI|nr:DHS-like NAD/FAD-binding domain-containing protein [Jaminaea rosea]PWN29323.1 DHS-like NAD/FAD-binding domain-containing protein [Jaminaea rosea]